MQLTAKEIIERALAVKHFEQTSIIRPGEISRVRVVGRKPWMYVNEVQQFFVADTEEQALVAMRDHMIEQSKKCNLLFYKPHEFFVRAYAPHNVSDHRIIVGATYGVARLPAEHNRMHPSIMYVEEKRFVADMLLQGVRVSDMPNPDGSRLPYLYNHDMGDVYIVPPIMLYTDYAEDSFAAYRELLKVCEKELKGFDSAWFSGSIHLEPTQRLNSSGGKCYRAVTMLMPFSSRNTSPATRPIRINPNAKTNTL